MGTSPIVAYTATASLPVATRGSGQSAVALPRRPSAALPAAALEEPASQTLLAAAALTWPRSATLGTLIDTWA